MTRPHPAPEHVDTTSSRYVGIMEAAAVLGVSERTARRWADEGTLKAEWRTPGGHRRFRLGYLEQARELVERGEFR